MNMPTKYKFIALITIALLVLAIDSQAQGISIEKGKTTKEEVSKFFGKPFLTKNIDNKECWFYESGDKVLGQKDANYVIYFQFSEKGILEDTYETTKNSIPNIKPKPSGDVIKKDLIKEQWIANQKKYGTPEQENRLPSKILWYYTIGEKPTEKENVIEREYRVIQFNQDGKFVKEFTAKTPVFTKKISKEESERLMKKIAEKYGRPNISSDQKK